MTITNNQVMNVIKDRGALEFIKIIYNLRDYKEHLCTFKKIQDTNIIEEGFHRAIVLVKPEHEHYTEQSEDVLLKTKKLGMERIEGEIFPYFQLLDIIPNINYPSRYMPQSDIDLLNIKGI